MISTPQRQVKILFGVPTPFEFKLVKKWQDEINLDIIRPKFYPEIKAYEIIRNYFLEHEEYTHLAIACSDIVVKPEHFSRLITDLKEFNYPVLTGMMNLALEFPSVYNITRNVVEPSRPYYDWFTDGDKMDDIQKVWFSGFPLMIIRRDIVERIPFERTSDLLGIDREVNCLDISFCWRCYEKKIPIFADTRVKLLHLKELNDESQPTLVGIEKPVTEIKKSQIVLLV